MHQNIWQHIPNYTDLWATAAC